MQWLLIKSFQYNSSIVIIGHSMKNLVQIKEAADIVGVSTDTIRRWDKKGLIRTVRSQNNYRLFNIEELERIKNKRDGKIKGVGRQIMKKKNRTGFKSIELFSGAGGLALGLELSGISNELLVEIDKNAVATLRLNRPDWNIIEDDIANLEFSEYKNKIDIVAGGFPCQAFSYAGNGLGFGDTRGTLFFEFAHCVEEVQPKIALAENVRGLLNHDKGRTLATIIKKLNDIGYKTNYRVLRSQFHDVPQKRERLIILGVRKDLEYPFLFPKEKDYTISIQEAFEDIPPSEGSKYPERKKYILDHVPPGGYWKDLPEDLKKEYMMKSYFLGGGKTGMARRLAWDEPSLTLTTSPAQKQTERCHPEETRPLNIREYARIQTFPDDWAFIGSIASQYRQIGNAVPVNLAYYIGLCLVGMLKGKINTRYMEAADQEEISSQLRLPII